MNINHYSQTTGEYITTTVARLDPVEKEPMIPAYATEKALPSLGANEAAIFENGDWVVKPDFRGVVYYKKTDGSQVTFNIGESPDDTMQPTVPAEIMAAKTESDRVVGIANAATQYIESVYSPLKQRKMMSVELRLQKKLIGGGVLTTDEQALSDINDAADLWIASVRDVENAAQLAGTLLADVVWPAKPA